MKRHLLISLVLALLTNTSIQAAGNGDPLAGESAWQREVPTTNAQPRSCVTCHGSDPRQAGTHTRTGNAIAPMAPSAEPTRFTDPAKVEKWFTRNCKWTWGRECSAQEKQDIQAWLYSF